jgi:hypothetical protein
MDRRIKSAVTIPALLYGYFIQYNYIYGTGKTVTKLTIKDNSSIFFAFQLTSYQKHIIVL